MEQTESSAEPVKASRLKILEKAPMDSHREFLDMDTDEEEFGHQETPEPLDESPPEPDKPQFTSTELDTLIGYAKELTVLPNLSPASWNDECADVIRAYFSDPTEMVLSIFFLEGKLEALLDFPYSTDSGLVYFLRAPWQVYTADNFTSTVVFGSMNDRAEKAILKFVEGVYAPLAFKHDDWPEIMKDEVFSNVNDFLTRAIDVTYKPMGTLILYVPCERIRTQKRTESREGVARAKYQKEQALLVNRLEKVARTWIKQIREVLRESADIANDLRDVEDEFEFWLSRYENLVCVSRQLRSERLLMIIERLRGVKSSSINDLKLLTCRVKAALEEAKSNLTYLDMVLKSCRSFDQLELIEDCMPRILYVIRFVWSESSFYSSPDKVERLLQSVSVYVMKTCIGKFDAKFIFDEPNKCKGILENNLTCCSAYSKIYDNVIENCLKNEKDWNVDKENVFKCIRAFEQRCLDVLEICDAILIYGSLNKINLGGTKGNYYEMQYGHMRDYFLRIMEEMRICCDYALDITRVGWFQDMSNFLIDIGELENTIKNILSDLFEDVKNVEMGIETLYTLLKFKERRAFQAIVKNKWIQVWELFNVEIKRCASPALDHQIVQDQIKYSLTDSTVTSDINAKFLLRLQKMMMNASDWLGDCDIQYEIPAKFLQKNNQFKD